MIYHKHPIRSLLTSMLRKANMRYPSDVYDKWCKILHSRPLLALKFHYWNFIFLYYFSHIFFLHLLTAIGWFIVNIQSDLFWHRCLERQTCGTRRMCTLFPSTSIKGSNYREFLKRQKIWEHGIHWKWARTWISALLKILYFRDVNRFWSSRQIDADCAVEPLLIFNEYRVPKFIFILVLTYYVNHSL
jgi:hypothetical protein